jgi:hypothetical protein
MRTRPGSEGIEMYSPSRTEEYSASFMLRAVDDAAIDF